MHCRNCNATLARCSQRDDGKVRDRREPMTVRQLKRSRHMSVMVESIHDDMRMFAEAIGLNSERLGDHETHLRRLEQRRLI